MKSILQAQRCKRNSRRSFSNGEGYPSAVFLFCRICEKTIYQPGNMAEYDGCLHKYSNSDNAFCWILILYFLLPYRFSFAALRIYLLPFARSSVYPTRKASGIWTYSSVVRFCQTTFATARTTFVDVHPKSEFWRR